MRTPFLAIIGVLIWVAGSWAGEAQVRFSLDDGWISVEVRQTEATGGDVKVRVLDRAVQTVAEGECDRAGKGSFPLPAGNLFLVGITVPGKPKEADLIVLRKEGTTLSPSVVRLSFSKPCCRAVSTARPVATVLMDNEAGEEMVLDSEVTLLLGGGGGCLVAAGMVLLVFRRW